MAEPACAKAAGIQKERSQTVMKKSETNAKLRAAVAVVGGGITGMQAALDMADAGFFVYIIEKSPAIGGVMAQLDKTFPTNDCAM